MYSFFQLTANEWLKMTKQKSFVVQLVLVLVAAIGIAAMMYKLTGTGFMTVGSFGRFLISMSDGGFIYLILCLMQVSGIVSKEHQQGTIKLLLIRAHTRTEILASKFFALVVYMVFLALYTIVVSYLAGALFFYNADGLMLEETFKQMAFMLIYTFSYVALGVMLSTLLKSTGGTIAILLVTAIVVDGLVVQFLSSYKYAKYILFFNNDFSQFVEGAPMLEGLTPTFSTIVYAIYVALFMLITFVVFKKRDVS